MTLCASHGTPSWDLYASKVTSRVRKEGRWLQAFAGLAAVVLLALTLWNVLPAPIDPQPDLHGLLAKYAAAKEADKAGLKDEIHALGNDVIPDIVAALKDTPIQVQIGAGRILKTYQMEQVQDLLVEMMAKLEPVDEPDWVLGEIGSEDDDIELVDVAFDQMLEDEESGDAVEVLRRLDRDGFNREARVRIVDRLVQLLKNKDSQVQKIGLDLIRELGIEFPVPALVEFLDSLELRVPALEILKQVTGEDFAYDKGAWKRYWASKAGM